MEESHTTATEALAPPSHPAKSRADKIFDGALYGGINGVGTFLLTIPLAYWGKYGGGAKFYERGGEALGKLGVNPKRAEEILLMLATSLGGTVMVLPTWTAEHFRKPIVGWIRQRTGEDVNTPHYDAPEQSFSSLIRGRLMAMATVMASFYTAGNFFPKQFAAFEESVAHKFCALIKKPTHLLGEETKAFRYGKMAAIDVFATSAAATILFTASRFFANHRKQQPAAISAAALETQPAREASPLSVAYRAPDDVPQPVVQGEKQHPGKIVALNPEPSVRVQSA